MKEKKKEPPRISALRRLIKTNFSDDAMELMLEHPERESSPIAMAGEYLRGKRKEQRG